MTDTDTGHRRRDGDTPRVITELIDVETVEVIAQEAWISLVGEDEVLVPSSEQPVSDPFSSWVDVAGPWTGSVVLTTGRRTAEELTRALLREHAPEVLDDEDVADAFGEIANVVGGNVKAALPGPSGLSLPGVGVAPPPADPSDACRIDLIWRGEPLSISLQGTLPATS